MAVEAKDRTRLGGKRPAGRVGQAHRRLPAIVLGGETIALSVARSLSASGVAVTCLGDAATDSVSRSRHCRTFVDVSDDRGLQRAWLDWLLAHPAEAVLLPCNDDGLELLANHRGRLEDAGFVLPEADDAVVLSVLDKWQTYRLAAEAGIPVPHTVLVDDPDTVPSLDGVRLPAALKPVNSHVFTRHFPFRTKALVVHDAASLDRAMERTVRRGIPMVLTEIVTGPERFPSVHAYVGGNEKVLCQATKCKLRQYPSRFGIGCYHVTDDDSEVAELGLRFIQAIGLRGVAHVEFKRDALDGCLKLIECNHRLTGSTEVLRLAGFDLALFIYRRLAGFPPPAMTPYRLGVRVWHPLEDALASYSQIRDGDLGVIEWGRTIAHRQHLPVLRLTDPRPAFANYGHLAARMIREAGRASLSGSSASRSR